MLLAGLQKAGVPGGATLCDADALPEAQFTAALATARRAAGEFFRRTPRKGGPPREQPLWWRAELDALQMYATAVQAGADSGATSSLLRAEFIAYLSCLLLGIRYPELEADCAGSTAVWAAGDDGASLGEIKTKSDGACHANGAAMRRAVQRARTLGASMHLNCLLLSMQAT